MAWTSLRAIWRRETTVDQEFGAPVKYTSASTPVRFWLAALLPLIVGAILLGRLAWLLAR